MKNKLYILTLAGFRDALRPVISDENCKATLLNFQDEDYVLYNNVLDYKGVSLSIEEVFELAANPNINKSIRENVLIYGIFSFLYSQRDLRNRYEFEVTESEMCKFLGLSIGANGFRLAEKLESLTGIFGVIEGQGIYRLIDVTRSEDKIKIKSLYFHRLLNDLLEDSFNEFGERAKYYTDKINASITSVKQKTAALIAIELSSLIARSKGKKAHISIRTLFYRVPQLMAIYLSKGSISFKNRQLKRIFSTVNSILDTKTDFPDELEEFIVEIPSIDIRKLDSVINISFKGYTRLRKECNNG